MVDPLVLAVPPGVDGLAAAAGSAWVLEPPGTAARAWAEALCREAGFEPRVRFESTDLALHVRLVRQGAASALLPRLTLAGVPDLAVLPLPGSPARTLDTAVRPGARRHPHVVAVRQALATAVRTVQP
jgi:DNA-binding transcriptional LysR family regulator